MIKKKAQKRNLGMLVFASSAGTLIEWYDFFVFGSMATILAQKFYPQQDTSLGFLATLATYTIGFIVRPFGGLLFGAIGDRLGRKYTFQLTLLLMGGATCCIGCLPTYMQAGVLAPVLLLIMRLLQGLAISGEYTGAVTYVAEHSPHEKRGFYTSFIQLAPSAGLLLSFLVILLSRSLLGESAFIEWGWRLPFLASGVMVLISLYVRKNLGESPVFQTLKQEGALSKRPIKESLSSKNLRLILIALFGAVAGQAALVQTAQLLSMISMEKYFHLNGFQTNIILIASIAIMLPAVIWAGKLSDKIGRKKVMMAGFVLMLLVCLPAYMGLAYFCNPNQLSTVHEISTSNLLAASALCGLMMIACALAYAPLAAFMVELFPTNIRYTSLSLPYNIGNGILGGITLFVATFMIEKLGGFYWGLAYPYFLTILSLVVGIIFVPETKDRDINT